METCLFPDTNITCADDCVNENHPASSCIMTSGKRLTLREGGPIIRLSWNKSMAGVLVKPAESGVIPKPLYLIRIMPA